MEHGQPSNEYQIKAAFLFNFAKFVEWPPATAAPESGPICMCILGRDPFGPALEEVIQGKTVNSRRLQVRRTTRVEQVRSCHVLFISDSERGRLSEALALLRDTSILTVGEMERFVQHGGMIHFLMESNKVRFEINRDAAERAGLKISSKLLQLATIVRGEGGISKR